MNKIGVVGVLIAAASGCGPKVTSPPGSDPDIVVYAGTEPVAVGSAISVSVWWHGWCEQPSIGVEGGGGAGEGPCKSVAHTASFGCEADACTWSATARGGYQLVPTKAGTLKAFATVTPRGGTAKTYPLKPIEVVVPDAVQMACTLFGDYSVVAIALTHGGKAVEASAPTLRVNDRKCTYRAPLEPGELSSPMTELDYTCDAADADARAQIEGPGYRFEATAPCAP